MIRQMEAAVTRTITVALQGEQAATLDKIACELGRDPEEVARLLLEEKLREEEYPLVEHRATVEGRIAYVRGHRTPVWMVSLVARGYEMDAQRVAEHFGWPRDLVDGALSYAARFADEINPVVDEVESTTAADLQSNYPGLRWREVGMSEPATSA
jgi:hypothetical protein